MKKTVSKTDIGLKRELNQDYVFTADCPVGKLPNLYLVADGMGGHQKGEVASAMAVEIISDFITNKKCSVVQSIDAANKEIYKKSSLEEFFGMGTTVVMCLIEDKKAVFANVGDSRLYLMEDSLMQITVDHSLVQEMIKIGELSKEDARLHPDKNIITRAVGAGRDINADYFEFTITKDSILLMCSDGLSNMVADDQIAVLLKSAVEPEKIGKKLIETANRNGGKDNIAVIVINSKSGEV